MAEPTLYDHRGEPIKRQELVREHAAPRLMGVRQPWGEGVVAPGLTPTRLASILRSAAEGDHYEYLTLAEEMEERDLHYASVLGTRKRGVSGLAPMVEAASDEARDVELADAVREDIAAQDWFAPLIEDMLDALGKGYSCCEIMWSRSASAWTPLAPVWRDPRWFLFAREDGRTVRLRDEANMMDGLPLAPFKWIAHVSKIKSGLPIRGGLARLAAAAFMCKSYGLSDWMRFAEVFGMPLRVGKYGPSATLDDISQLIAAVANLGTDAAAAIPDSMRIDFVESKATGGDGLFPKLAEYWDKQVSKGVLGQTMTTDDGSSLAQAQIHAEVRRDILEADARQVEATLNRDLVKAYIDLNWGPQRRYPRLRVPVPQPEDIATLSDALSKLVPLGLRVEASVIRDKLGLPDPDEGAEVLVAPGQTAADTLSAQNREQRRGPVARNRQDSAAPDELDDLAAEAMADWEEQLDPLISPVERLADECGSFEEFLARLGEAASGQDATALTMALAEAAYKARGLGASGDA